MYIVIMIKTSKVCLALMLYSLTIQSHTAAVNTAAAAATTDCNEAGCYQSCLGINCTKGGTCILGECACLGCIHEELQLEHEAQGFQLSDYLDLSSWRIGCNKTECQSGCEKNYCNIGRCNLWGCGCFDCNHTWPDWSDWMV